MSASVWNRTTRIVVLVLLSVAGAWFLWRIRPMFGPLVIAGFVAYLLNPVVDFAVARTRLRRGVASTIVFFGAIVLLVALGLAIVRQPVVGSVVAEIGGSLSELETIDRQVESALGIDLQLDDLAGEFQQRLERWLNVDNLLGLAQALTANAAWTLVAMVTIYYLLKDWSRLRRWLLPLVRVDLLPGLLDARTAGLLGRSLWMAATGGTGALLLGWSYALLCTRLALPAGGLFRLLLIFPLLLPPLLVAQAWYGLTGMSGPWAAVFTYAVVYAPLPGLFAARALDLQAASAHEAALLVGPRLALGEMLRGSLLPAVSGALLAALFALSDFAVPDYFATVGELFHVYSAEVFGYSRSEGFQAGASASLPLVGVGLAALLLLVRLQERQRVHEGDVERPAAPLAAGPWKTPLALLLCALLGLLLLAPLGRVVYETGMQGPESTRGWGEVSATAFREAVAAGRGDILRSLGYAGMAGLFTLLLAPLWAHALLRAGRRLRRVLLVALCIPLLVPSVALGFGGIVAFNRPWLDGFYTSLFLPALLVAGRFLPVAVLLLYDRLRRVPATQEDAAALAGVAYPARVFRVRLGPQRSAWLLAGGLVVAFGIRELDFALLTYAANSSAAVRYFNALHFSRDNLVAALGLILALILFLPVALHAAGRALGGQR